MKMFQRMLGILLVAAASAGLLAACGESSDDSCIDSNDCAADERCNLETETCGFACSPGDGVCLDDEVCDENAGDGGGVCVFTGDNNGNNGNNGGECTVATEDVDCAEGEICDNGTCVAETECTTSDECTEEGAICVDGACEVPPSGPSYPYARIEDISDESNDDLCGASISDPGSDLFAIRLTQNGTEYWAQWENYDNIVEDGNSHSSPIGIINGEPLDLTGDCPETFDSSTIVALGCGGSMIVSFPDEQGNPQVIEDGAEITPFEYGNQCNGETVQDQWQVSLCSADSNLDPDEADCADEVTINSGSGDASVTVEIPQE